MRALLSGYYGFGNLGDEALLEVIVQRVRARFPTLQLDVLSNAPETTAAALSVEAIRRWDWPAVRAAIGRADVVISGGGGLLQNATSLRSLVYYAAILREAIRRGRKTMVFAQSIGPLDLWGRFLVRRFCRGLSRATVRDARSAELLHELLSSTPVECTADPVFLYDLAPNAVDLAAEGLGSESTPYAIVSVRKVPTIRDGIQPLARAVDRLAERHNVRVAFLPLGGTSDAEVSTEVIRKCKSAPVLLPTCDLAKAAAILRGAHLAIGMRLHALILAARFAVPFLAIPYDPKVSALCEELAYPLDPLWVPSGARPTDEFVDATVDRAMAERAALAEHLAERLAAVRASAERNFDILGELLEK